MLDEVIAITGIGFLAPGECCPEVTYRTFSSDWIREGWDGNGPARSSACSWGMRGLGFEGESADAANLFFQLVASRYEHASLIMTSNLSFGLWGEVFGDPTVASAMIDRILHHADALSLTGASYRLKSHQPAADTA